MINIEKLLDEYKRFVTRKYKTKDCFYNIKLFFKFLEDYNLDIGLIVTMDYDFVIKYYSYLKAKDLTIDYFNNMIKAFRFFCLFLWHKKIINKEQLLLSYKIKTLYQINRKHGGKIAYLTLGDINKILAKISMDYKYCTNPYKFKALFYFMYYTGIQKEDLAIIKRENINLNDNTVYLEKRTYFFPDAIKDILQKYFDSEEEKKNAFNILMKTLYAVLRKYSSKKNKLSINFCKKNFAQMLRLKKIDYITSFYLVNGKMPERIDERFYIPTIEDIKKTYLKRIR
jgi:integrase